jgi:SAM-dependent methyltransferase
VNASGIKLEWVQRSCPLCGPGSPSHVLAESNIDPAKLDQFAFASRKLPEYMHPRLMECESCRIVYGDPVLSLESIAAGYQEAAFDSGNEANYASLTYQRLIDNIKTQMPDCDSALDIGTGDGVFLERLLESGFQRVRGIEPSAAPVAAAKPHIRELIQVGLFDPADYQPGSFTLITCFQVMEHVWDPLALCQGALSLLKPGGALVAVVHNRHALSAKVLGRKSPIFDIEHLQLFSARSGRRLLELAGFIGVDAQPIWNHYPLHYWMKLFPFPAAIKKPLLAFATAAPPFRIPLSLPAGNLVISGFRPVE